MTDNSVTLPLPEFEQKMFLRLNELRLENQCCDVRFEINGRTFPCHRLVLTAISPYFNTMFNGNFRESSSDTIPLKEIEAEIFEEILNAIYTAKLRVNLSNAYSIFKASHALLLKDIEELCVSYIDKNRVRVHYLVDICLFSKNVQQTSLHSQCLNTIIKDLINYSQMDSFMQMPMDDFKTILSKWKPKEHEEAFTVTLIWKWSKQNQVRREDVQLLLAIPQLKTSKYINPMLMAQFLTSSYKIPGQIMNEISAESEKDFNFDLDVYLNLVDVKTGQKGWGVLKINDKFDTYYLSSFHITHSSYKSVCKAGSNLYCFEYFSNERRNVFYYYDGKDKISLPTPGQNRIHEKHEKATLVMVGTSIYFMAEESLRFVIWIFDCELKTWKQLLKKTDLNNVRYDWVIAYTFLNNVFYVVVERSSCQYLLSINSQSLIDKKAVILSKVTGCYQYHIYGFDDILALYTVYDDFPSICTFNISSKSYNDRKVMNTKFGNGRMICHNGFLCIMENEGAISQKFDFKLETFSELPSLPKRVTFCDESGERSLFTGSVFGSNSKHSDASKGDITLISPTTETK